MGLGLCKFPAGLLSKDILPSGGCLDIVGWCTLGRSNPDSWCIAGVKLPLSSANMGKVTSGSGGFFAHCRTAVRSLLPAPHTHSEFTLINQTTTCQFLTNRNLQSLPCLPVCLTELCLPVYTQSHLVWKEVSLNSKAPGWRLKSNRVLLIRICLLQK